MTTVEQRKKLWDFIKRVLLQLNEPSSEIKWYPLSRSYMVHSLMHLSRAALRKIVTVDKISQLKMPSCLVGYMLDDNYLLDELGPPPKADKNKAITSEHKFDDSWIPQPPTVPPKNYLLRALSI